MCVWGGLWCEILAVSKLKFSQNHTIQNIFPVVTNISCIEIVLPIPIMIMNTALYHTEPYFLYFDTDLYKNLNTWKNCGLYLL